MGSYSMCIIELMYETVRCMWSCVLLAWGHLTYLKKFQGAMPRLPVLSGKFEYWL